VTHRYVLAMALSPDGRSLAVADNAGLVAVYEVATGQVRREIAGHRALLTGLAQTRDGKRLLTASLDGSALVWDVTPAAAFPRPARAPTADELTKSWGELALPEAATAYRAMAALTAFPREAVAQLAGVMSPAAGGPDAAALDKLVADLASEKFAVREKASADLDRLGEAAVPGLRERLAAVASAEARRRIIRLLDAHDPVEMSPRRLQTLRALELLEGIGTPDATALLAKLAAGTAGAWQTREAKAALQRLAEREPGAR
jgi:hypothetical protein